ncbi:nucleotidyltransferase domain-containing protein [Candidatus Woesearchaeota archaeon]|nr:nucleotidyltransferase domain-containing protein [Candidatus Woesearchaeota archaeon]
MIGKSSIDAVMAVIFQSPTTEFHLRQLEKVTGLSMPTIISATDKLARMGLITKEKGKIMTLVKANAENRDFIRYKRLYNIRALYESGIVDWLDKAYNHPQAIVLFGSFSRGEDIEKSDIDLAVKTTRKQRPDTAKYEKMLGKRVSIHEVDERISEEFKASLHNGIVLEGSW